MGTTLMRWLLRVTGAGLLAATAAIHLDLYLTGYRSIPTIGWLFLLQVIAAFALALVILLAPLFAITARPIVDAGLSAAGAGFSIATLGGYLLSLWIGLFGFREIRTTAGVVAGLLEIGAFAVLATLAALTADGALAALPASRSAPGAVAPRLATARKLTAPTIVAASVAAIALFGASVAANGGSNAAVTAGGAAVLRTTTIGGISVLTNANGRTLYWFAPDKPGHSVCYGVCAAYWPPVTGTPTAGPGVTLSKLGTTARTDGTIQVTYDGHPLYTYVSDTGPGQASGNNVNLNGGVWHEMPAAG